VSDPQGILISGVYGVGKSTVTAQLADLLEARGVRYAALDLDWLSWAWTEEEAHEQSVDRLMVEHLGLVVGNLRRRGNDRFVLAGSIMSEVAWQAIQETMAMPVRLVELRASLDTVRGRLGNEPTTGRLDDLAQTESWLAEPPPDAPVPDVVLDNEGPITETAQAILDWTGWVSGPLPEPGQR
jgi:hypothetical protein